MRLMVKNFIMSIVLTEALELCWVSCFLGIYEFSTNLCSFF